MKKLLLTLVAVIFIVVSLFSQTYIGDSKDYIMKDVSGNYTIDHFSYESNVFSITFKDGHSAIYVLDENDLCNYYVLVYNISYLSDVVENCNTVGTKIGDFKWYLIDNGENIYLKINTSSVEDKVIYLSIYPLEYESELNGILIGN